MTLPSEAQAMLTAIAAAPAEDLPRLAFADWLDEHGQGARAEFIRVQIELVRFESFEPAHRKEFNELARANLEKRMSRLERGDSESIKIAKAIEDGGRLYRERHESLRTRERELLLSPDVCLPRIDTTAFWPVAFHRGFLSKVTCSWADAAAHLDSILADPWVPGLDEVELTTWPSFDEATSLAAATSRLLPMPMDGRDETWSHVFNARWTYTIDGKTVAAVRSWKLPPEPRAEPPANYNYASAYAANVARRGR